MRYRLILPLLAALLIAVLAACGDDSDDSGASETETMPDMEMTAASSDSEDEGMADMDHGSGASSTTEEEGVSEMNMDRHTDDHDLHFIDAMIIHHGSAIEMAEVALDKAEHPEITKLTEEIIAAQEQEIAQMQEWRDAWYPNAPQSDLSGMQDMAGMSMGEDDMQHLAGAEDFDLAFIEMMIPHHQSAIDMAEQLLETTERPELQQLAHDIIAAQQSEIDQMQQWQEEWAKE